MTTTQLRADKAKPADKSDSKPADDQAAAADDVFGSHDVLTDLKAARGPLQPTAIDAQGIERIVGPAVDDNWSPAQVDPDPEAIAHRERVAEHTKTWRDERLHATQVPAAKLADGAEVTKGALAAERGE